MPATWAGLLKGAGRPSCTEIRTASCTKSPGSCPPDFPLLPSSGEPGEKYGFLSYVHGSIPPRFQQRSTHRRGIMIPRYSRKEMEAIWSPQNRFQKWLDIEILACEALAQKGDIPRKALRTIREKARFDVERIDEIERTVKHDVIAFLTSVSDYIGDDSRFVHLGLTSSDVLDTSFAMLLKEASDLIITDIKRLMEAIRKRAFE